jgi:hypothetical protein
MMNGMGSPPRPIRHERQNAEYKTEAFVGTARFKERTVSTIMLNNEQANKKSGSR